MAGNAAPSDQEEAIRIRRANRAAMRSGIERLLAQNPAADIASADRERAALQLIDPGHDWFRRPTGGQQ